MAQLEFVAIYTSSMICQSVCDIHYQLRLSQVKKQVYDSSLALSQMLSHALAYRAGSNPCRPNVRFRVPASVGALVLFRKAPIWAGIVSSVSVWFHSAPRMKLIPSFSLRCNTDDGRRNVLPTGSIYT
jgi:hypothetical protein